jgi:hypothetical protein
MTAIRTDNYFLGIGNISKISIGSFDLKQTGQILKAKSYAKFREGKNTLAATQKNATSFCKKFIKKAIKSSRMPKQKPMK